MGLAGRRQLGNRAIFKSAVHATPPATHTSESGFPGMRWLHVARAEGVPVLDAMTPLPIPESTPPVITMNFTMAAPTPTHSAVAMQTSDGRSDAEGRGGGGGRERGREDGGCSPYLSGASPRRLARTSPPLLALHSRLSLLGSVRAAREAARRERFSVPAPARAPSCSVLLL